MNEQGTIYGSIAEPSDLIKIKTYSIRKTILCIAYIDFFVKLLNAFVNISNQKESLRNYGYYNLVCSSLIFIGIIGINRYYNYISYGYAVYLTSQIIIILLLIFLININYITFIFCLLILFIESWILKLLCKFITNIKLLPESDLLELREGWTPNVMYARVYY